MAAEGPSGSAYISLLGAEAERVPPDLLHFLLLIQPVQEVLQPLDVADGAPQYLHLGQPLVGVGHSPPFQSLEGFVYLLQPSPLPQGGCLPSVRGGRLSLASFTSPDQTLAGEVRGL